MSYNYMKCRTYRLKPMKEIEYLRCVGEVFILAEITRVEMNLNCNNISELSRFLSVSCSNELKMLTISSVS